MGLLTDAAGEDAPLALIAEASRYARVAHLVTLDQWARASMRERAALTKAALIVEAEREARAALCRGASLLGVGFTYRDLDGGELLEQVICRAAAERMAQEAARDG